VAEPKTKNADAKPVSPAAPREQKISFDTSDLKSSYCNVCNATSTREEVVLNFGINHTWDRDQTDVAVKLQHRIIISPHAAKRFQNLMTKLITEHEARYGKLD